MVVNSSGKYTFGIFIFLVADFIEPMMAWQSQSKLMISRSLNQSPVHHISVLCLCFCQGQSDRLPSCLERRNATPCINSNATLCAPKTATVMCQENLFFNMLTAPEGSWFCPLWFCPLWEQLRPTPVKCLCIIPARQIAMSLKCGIGKYLIERLETDERNPINSPLSSMQPLQPLRQRESKI